MTRHLGPASASALVVASMIGTGAFTISGFALEALGRRLPLSGGEYTLLSRELHPLAGVLAGWLSLLAGFTAPLAAAALGLEAYLGATLGAPGPLRGAGALALGAVALAQLSHARAGVRLVAAATALELAGIAAFIAFGAPHTALRAGTLLEAPVHLDLGAFGASVVWISFAYSGGNAAIYVAGELRDPERDLSRSLLAATALVTGVYLVLQLVFLLAAPVDALAGRAEIGAVAAEAFGGAPLRRALGALVALALLASIASLLMTGSRVVARMAEDGVLPAWLRTSGGAPRAALAAQASLALVATLVSDLAELLGAAGFALGLSSAATVAVLMRLRAREGCGLRPAPWLAPRPRRLRRIHGDRVAHPCRARAPRRRPRPLPASRPRCVARRGVRAASPW